MKAISVGKRVFSLRVKGAHSSFSHALNFDTSTGILLSIVPYSVGGGPNNIVLNVEDLNNIKRVEFDDKFLNIDDEKIAYENSPVFDSSFGYINGFDSGIFLSNIEFLRKVVLDKASPLSCAFLLDEKRESFFITPFEKKLRDRIKGAFNSYMEGKLEALLMLKGLGIGLTPQGDDLIKGSLISLLIYENLHGIELTKVKRKIYEYAKGYNAIVNTFLFFACRGELYEKERNLLKAIIQDGEYIYEKAIEVISQGETSGADFLTGFILTTEKMFEGGILWQ